MEQTILKAESTIKELNIKEVKMLSKKVLLYQSKTTNKTSQLTTMSINYKIKLEIGIISKMILNKINNNIRSKTKLVK